MAYDAHAYTKFGLSLATKKIDFSADTVAAVPLSSYTIGGTRDSAQFESAIVTAGVGVEASGGSYVAGGVALGSLAYTLDATNHRYILSSASIVFSTSPISVAWVLFVDTTPGSPATNPIICYWDLGGTQSITGLTPDPTNGIVTVKAV